MVLRSLFCSIATLLTLTCASFSAAVWADVEVSNAWIRATVPAQSAAGVFMTLQSTESIILVSASSPVANNAELHQMTVEGGIANMRAIPGLRIPANTKTQLKPGGYHIMLLDLKKRPLKAGETVPIKLTVQSADGKFSIVSTTAQVQGLAMPPAPKP